MRFGKQGCSVWDSGWLGFWLEIIFWPQASPDQIATPVFAIYGLVRVLDGTAPWGKVNTCTVGAALKHRQTATRYSTLVLNEFLPTRDRRLY
jgi:hypothetical protein